MKSSLTTISIIVCIVIFSIFVANVSNLINIEKALAKRSANEKQYQHEKHFKVKHPFLLIDDKSEHLMWFLQISDIHISIFGDEERINDFRLFATETLDTIKPSVVLASGDLTDAKDSDYLGSRQYEAEWKIYYEILQSANVRNKTVWMDIRGNHDNFNVPAHIQAENMFRRYSVQGKEHKRSYMKHIVGSSGEIYTFIGVDACLEPGPKRPFNFIGLLNHNDTNYLERQVERARQMGSNYTIWFGHYPTSCIMTLGSGSHTLRRIIGDYEDGLAYMCGHLHTLGGMIPEMYTLQQDGFLELELADWKASRMIRLAAVDHGLFSFIDVKHSEWPKVLITNPKHALFHIPHKQEAKLQLESTHIRLLAFSPIGVANCSIKIDAHFDKQCKQVTESLFVVEWDPKMYEDGVHHIRATVVDKVGREKTITQPFKLDDKHHLNFGMMARFVLMGDTSTLFKYFFAFALAICVVPLIFFRIWHTLIMAGKLGRQRPASRTTISFIQRFWILSTVDRIFWPILVYCFYLSIGPWSIGEVVDDHIGVIFIWGIYIDGSYLPGSLTFLYGFFQLILCQFPLICIYATCIEKRYKLFFGYPIKKYRATAFSLRKLSQIPFCFIMSIEVLLAIFFGLAYGTVAFLLGPFRTWSVILDFTLWYMARNIPDQCLKPAAYVWGAIDKPTKYMPSDAKIAF